MHRILPLLLSAIFMLSFGQSVEAQRKKKKAKNAAAAPAPKKDKGALKSIEEYTKKFQKMPGLFTMYQDSVNGKTYMEISEDQIGKEFIYFSYVENGVVAGGNFRGSFRGSKIFTINKAYDKLQFQVENTSYYFDPENAISRASQANVNNPIVFATKVVAADKDKALLIESDGLFMGETFNRLKPVYPPTYRGFQLGRISKDKSRLLNIKNYPENTDFVVKLVWEGSGRSSFGSREVTDGRFVGITYQHSLIEVPDNDYKPRVDDERVGYFSTQVTDLTRSDVAPYRDMIHRWHLQKTNPGAAVSDVVEPITYWIENTTPEDVRDMIKEGVETWNEAFEAAGYRNAVVVKVQPDDADWDAGDIRYNVLRWTSSPRPPFGGYGPSFVNPRTGQILGADIMLEYTYILGRYRQAEVFDVAAMEHEHEAIFGMLEDGARHLGCSAGHAMAEQMAFAKIGFDILDNEADKKRFIEESVKRLMLHEVGHTLGLSHNMKGSTIQSVDDIKNLAKMKEEGLCNSVMEYPAINFPASPEEVSVFYDDRPGFYDHWVIDYGYSEALEDPAQEKARLEAILKKSADPKLAFGNDADDMRSNGKGMDPMVNIYDLSNDPVRYAREQIDLVEDRLMPGLMDKALEDGESYQKLRSYYFNLIGHKMRQLRVISKHVGGIYVNRAVEGAPGTAVDPYSPMPESKQKAAVNALYKYAFGPQAWQVDGELIRHLQLQRRGFNQPYNGEDPKLHSSILGIQRGLLGHLLNANVLNRFKDTEQYGNSYELAEYMNDLTDAIFVDDKAGSVNSIRQNLQLEYTKRLIDYLENPGAMGNTKSEALFQINRIKVIARSNAGDQSTQGHRMHLRDMIRRMEQAGKEG